MIVLKSLRTVWFQQSHLLGNVSSVAFAGNAMCCSSLYQIVFSDTMANIIFAEQENARLHPPPLKMRQRLQSAPGM